MKLDPDGVLRIPADVGGKAGFKPGEEVDVKVEHGALHITPLDVEALRLRRMEEGLRDLGDLPPPLRTTEEVMALTRGED
jgi:antitoxin component of MazEF toxin-antitoxin module